MNPDCVLLTWSVFWKCLFNTSSIAWQNPQMKNSEETMIRANNKACRLFDPAAGDRCAGVSFPARAVVDEGRCSLMVRFISIV